MIKTKTDKLFFAPSRINISDEDLIERSHGFRDSQELLANAVDKLTEVLQTSRTKESKEDIQKNEAEKSVKAVLKIISKQDLRKKLKRVKKDIKFGAKEKQLLDILSDFEPHKTKGLAEQVKTSAHRKLKQRIVVKLKGTDFFIRRVNSDSLYKEPCYLLGHSLTAIKL